MSGERARDWFESEDTFNRYLEAAEENAVSDEEMDFVDQLTTKVKQYGFSVFLSERQYEWLKRIAKIDD